MNVNPPPQIPLPREFAQNPEARTYFDQIQRILLQLWQKTGGAEDFNEIAEQLLVSVDSRVSKNTAIIDYLSNREKLIFTSVGITAKRFDTIICTNSSSINITLDTNAKTGDVVNIKRQNAEVIVIGTIDGNTDMVINVPYYSAKLVYNGTDWSRV